MKAIVATRLDKLLLLLWSIVFPLSTLILFASITKISHGLLIHLIIVHILAIQYTKGLWKGDKS